MSASGRTPLLILGTALVAIAILSLWTFREVWRAGGGGSQPSDNARVLNRTLQAGEIRVGYLVLPPYLSKETSTGKLSGIFYDVTEEMGRRLGLKINWTEEVNIATFSEGLKSGKYDMIAFPLWRSASRAKNMAFSTPLFYSTLGIYVRADDPRFDNNIAGLNSSSVTVVTMDGELAGEIAKSDFPNAKTYALPQIADYNQMLLEITTRKADVTFFNRVMAKRFMARNPNKLKDISGETPIRVFAECFLLPIDDAAFRSMIDSTLLEMIENGQVDRAFSANGENPNEYFRPARPYRDPTP